MTQIWSDDKVIAVTPVLAGPCVVTQVKTKTKDGYDALQLAFGERKSKNINKPQLGHFKKVNVKPEHVRELRLEAAGEFKAGDIVSVETFSVGETIDVIGTSKGRGFQGVVKRHHFSGHKKTHGDKDQERMPGSIGPKGPAHVFKGTRMGGRMGGDRVTVSNLKVAAIDADKNIIFVAGAIPGAINSLVAIQAKGELKVNLKKSHQAAEAVAENIGKTQVVNEEVKTTDQAEVKEEAKAEVKAEVKPAGVEPEETKSVNEEVKTVHEEMKSEEVNQL